MGYWKERQIELIKQGYLCDEDKYVCANCVSNYGLKQLITEEATENRCDYCNSVTNYPIAVSLDTFIGFVMEGVFTEWAHADDVGVPYETAEGGYQWNVTDLEDIISGYYGSEIGIYNDDLWDDIVSCLNDQPWAKRNEPNPNSTYEMISWEEFCDQVKFETRFVFFQTRPDKSYYIGEEPAILLESLGNFIEDLELIKTFNEGSIFFRARSVNNRAGYSTAEDLGPPPKESASAGRMNPTGIPMFYGAFDPYTAAK